MAHAGPPLVCPVLSGEGRGYRLIPLNFEKKNPLNILNPHFDL